MSISHLDSISMEDKIAIINRGVVNEYGQYKNLAKNKSSQIFNFFKSKEELEDKMSSFKNISADDMKQRLKNAVTKQTLRKASDTLSDGILNPTNMKGNMNIKQALQNILK